MLHDAGLPAAADPCAFDCGGGCHGTMTQWVNVKHDGVAITVELGDSPSRHQLKRVAPRGLLKVLGGSR